MKDGRGAHPFILGKTSNPLEEGSPTHLQNFTGDDSSYARLLGRAGSHVTNGAGQEFVKGAELGIAPVHCPRVWAQADVDGKDHKLVSVIVQCGHAASDVD